MKKVFVCRNCNETVEDGETCACRPCIRCEKWSRDVGVFEVGDEIFRFCADDRQRILDFANKTEIR